MSYSSRTTPPSASQCTAAPLRGIDQLDHALRLPALPASAGHRAAGRRNRGAGAAVTARPGRGRRANATPRAKPGQNAIGLNRPEASSISPTSPVPALQRYSLPSCSRGECGIVSPLATTSPLATSMTQPLPVARLRASACGASVCPGGSDEAWPAFLHRESVEMAAILRPQRGDEARLPDRAEARLLVHRGKAGEQRVDEYRTSCGSTPTSCANTSPVYQATRGA